MKKNLFSIVNIIVPIAALVIGILIGFFICKKSHPEDHFTDKNNLTKSDIDYIAKVYSDSTFTFTKSISHPITAPMAYTLIKEFQGQNNGTDFPITNYKHTPLKSYYIDKDPILKIFNEDPTYTGITFYYAEDSTAYANKVNGLPPKRIFTLIYMGAKETLTPGPNNTVDTSYNNHDAKNNLSTPYDFIKPCPDFCSNFEATPPSAKLSKETNKSVPKKN